MINVNGTGIYIAYPRSENVTQVTGGPGSGVNCRYTKVGTTADSFYASGRAYRRAFENQVKFMPLVEIPARHLPYTEEKILAAVAERFPRVGATPNWFDTQDRASIISLIYNLLSPAANESFHEPGVALQRSGL